MTSCIDRKIAEIRANFASLIEKQTEDVVWARDQEALEAAQNRLKMSYASQSLFDAIIAAPPRGMVLTLFPVFRKNAEQNERGLFPLSVKRDFLRAICRDPENFKRLRAMNVTLDHAAYMRSTGLVPRDHNGVARYDITFDHIHEIQIGGKTVSDNLCLLPRGLNLLKGTFVRIQTSPHWPQKNAEGNMVLGLAPEKVGGVYPKVPLIEGGFKPSYLTGKKSKAIEESLTVHASLI